MVVKGIMFVSYMHVNLHIELFEYLSDFGLPYGEISFVC